MRTGLLDPGQHLMPTGQITPAPGFRTIIPAVYNEPAAGSAGASSAARRRRSSDPVAIPNDGVAMMVYLAGPAPVTPGEFDQATIVSFGQFVPRPYCSNGPSGLAVDRRRPWISTTPPGSTGGGRYSYVRGI